MFKNPRKKCPVSKPKKKAALLYKIADRVNGEPREEDFE